MRQYFIKISLIFIAFLLSSCGGGSTTSSSSGKGSNELKIETKQALFNEEDNLLNIDFLVKNNYNRKIDVSLKNLSIEVKPCNVKRVSMTPNNIYFSEKITEQYVSALVELIGSCTPNSYKISSSKILTLDDKSNTISYKSEEIEIKPDIAVPTDINNTNLTETYKFFNTPAPLNIELPDTEYSFKIQLIDNKFRGVSGKEVRVLTYDIRYGEIQNFVVTTDENGFANFLFKSAKDLSLLTGKKLSLTIVQGEEPSTISNTINLKFKDANAIPKNYQLKNPTSIVIQNGGESKNISVDIVNSLGIGEPGKTVQITSIPGNFGSINTSRTVTNDSGRAIFKYTAPDSLDAINNKSVTVTMSFKDGDKELSKTAKITIRKSLELDENEEAEEVEVLEVYSFQNATSITVSKVNEEKNISIDLVDSMGIGTAGKTVKISNIPSHLGTFTASTASTNESGRATFQYIGPEDISDIDVESIKVNLIFINEDDRKIIQPININFAISDNPHIPIDYKLSLNTDNDDFSMGIPELQKRFTIILKDKKGDIVKNNDVNFTKIHVQTENSLIAQIYDTTNKKLVNESTLKNENSASFIIKSKKLSGIVPLKATIEFLDINKEEKKLSTIINVRVMSGPPSAISISYVGTGHDASRAKYEEKFAVSVTDEYGNKVNTQPYISLGAIVGYTVNGGGVSKEIGDDKGIGKATKRLYYGKSAIDQGDANGHINKKDDNNSQTTEFYDDIPTDVFQWVNGGEGDNTDKLIVFGTGKNYEAMGKWDFKKIDGNFNKLILEDDYFGENRENLFYAIGHNYYQDQCLDDGREWIGSTDSDTYQLDDEGTVIISYKYDYHLTGKDALIWVNLNGYQSDTGRNTRIGEAKKHTLRGKGLKAIPSSVTISEPKEVIFYIAHAPENVKEWYRNAKFGYTSTGTCIATNPHTSNKYDARTCNNGGSSEGVAYVSYTLSLPTDAKTCTYSVSITGVSNEF